MLFWMIFHVIQAFDFPAMCLMIQIQTNDASRNCLIFVVVFMRTNSREIPANSTEMILKVVIVAIHFQHEDELTWNIIPHIILWEHIY